MNVVNIPDNHCIRHTVDQGQLPILPQPKKKNNYSQCPP